MKVNKWILLFLPTDLQILIFWMNDACCGMTMRGSLYFMNKKVTFLFMQIIISFAFGPLFLKNVDLLGQVF